ncbi:MAG: hypothetical protein ACOYD4_06865 [Solirubrobacterales bacterium]
MAHVFAITDGTTTFAITSTTANMQQYDMGVAGEGEETTVDTVALHIRGSSGSNMQTNVRTLEALLEAAKRRRKKGIGPRVYVMVTLDTDGSGWRSELVGGALDLSPASLAVWANNQMPAELTLERMAFWEAASEVELQLSAPNQSAATGGRTIYNHWDSDTGHGYWVQIAAAQVGGNLPAPFRLELANSVGSGRAYNRVHAAVNVLNDPANFAGRIEGESWSSGASTEADASSSGGNRATFTVNTSTTVTWALNDAFVVDASGMRFWMLARVVSLSGHVTVRPELRTGAGTTVWQSHEPMQWDTTTAHLAVLGTLPIPPGGYDTTWDDVVLALVFTSSASVTVKIDYIAFMPCDNYRLVTMLGESVANGGAVVVDDMTGYAGVSVSSLMRPLASPRGNPMLLYPAQIQRIYVLQDIVAGCNIADTFSVRVYFRARRATV